MTTQRKAYLTPREYLALERQASFKSEYFAGEIFAMSGASRNHNLIATNVATSLNNQLVRRPCEVYQSDMRVQVAASSLYTYPDVVVVCGHPQFEDAEVDTLCNPTLIVEVLSPTTEAYDRGQKFEYYRTVTSLTGYILIAQDRRLVEHYARQENGGWILHEAKGNMVIQIPSINCRLMLDDIYRKVTFEDRLNGS